MSLFSNVFGSVRGAAPAAPISGAEARRLMAEEGAFLLDVRTSREFADGHAEGAVNIPLQQLSGRRDEVPSDCTVIVYCLSGGRSASAAAMLSAAGYTVLDAGGISNVMR